MQPLLKYIIKLISKLKFKGYMYVPFILGILCYILSWSIYIPIIASLLIWTHLIVAYNTRKYSRNIVYNYTLKNDLWYPRLQENKITEYPLTYIIDSTYKGKLIRGKIYKKEVSKLKYLIVFYLLYGWFDDDCDVDTVPIGYGEDILEGKHFGKEISEGVYKSYLPKFIYNYIKKEQTNLEKQQRGKAFHLGDLRTKVWSPLLSFMWMIRNTAYNFNYVLEECDPNSKDFFYRYYPNLDWHFGYIPKENKDRVGRMVWFKEDIDKVSKEVKELYSKGKG